MWLLKRAHYLRYTVRHVSEGGQCGCTMSGGGYENPSESTKVASERCDGSSAARAAKVVEAQTRACATTE